ncbi:hypothetical protein V8D89_000984 [Ganoderma adspersum]
MALDQSGTLDHGSPLIVLLVLCPAVFIMVTVYYLVRYCIRKDRQRRKQRDSANPSSSTSSVITTGAPPRELHRWIPSLPPPTTPTPSPVPRTPPPRHSVSEHSIQTEPRSLAPSGQSTPSLHQYSLPISELDPLPTSNAVVPLTPPPSATIHQDATGHVGHWPHHDQDPFADQDPSYVRGAEPDAHTHGSAVAVPTPAASIRSSVDVMSIATSSTLPPSYRTHRSIHGTASDAPFSGHGRRRDMAHTAAEEHGPTSYQAPSDRRLRYYPRKSMDGGVRLDGGPLDPATGRGPEEPPQYGKKL